MEAIGKIGVLMGAIFDPLDYQLLKGIHMQASLYGYDTLVFTSVQRSQSGLPYDSWMHSMENIFNLAVSSKLDGILFIADRFKNDELIEKLSQDISKKIPCLVTGIKSERFPSLIAEQRKYTYEMTQHLIKEHDCKSLYFLSGFPDEYNSEERLKGFNEALEEAGFEISDSNIFYGNFWTEKSAELARDIISGKIPKPDGIVCASDPMAMALCDEFTANGISVPDDILITGYDGGYYSLKHEPTITTYAGIDEALGQRAVNELVKIIGNTDTNEISNTAHIRLGESCGCCKCGSWLFSDRNDGVIKHFEKIIENHTARNFHFSSNFISELGNSDSLENIMNFIEKHSYIMPQWKKLDICLCEDWLFNFDDIRLYRTSDFSHRMMLAFSQEGYYRFADGYYFDTPHLLPSLNEPHKPTLTVFTSLFSNKQVFGYIATTYNDPLDVILDDYYVNWCDAISNGLNNIQKILYSDYISQQLSDSSFHDPSTAFYNLRGLKANISPAFQSRKENTECYMTLLSYIDTENNIDIDFSLLTANALRLHSENNELISHLSDRVFAIIIFTDNSSVGDEIAEIRLDILKKAIYEMYGEYTSIRLPKYKVCGKRLNEADLSEIDRIIAEQTERLTDMLNDEDNSDEYFYDMIYKVKRELVYSPSKNWKLSETAKSVGMSVSTFQRYYKQLFSVSFMEDVINARIAKAKHLLQYSNMTIQEISDLCGYSSPAYFMRQFKAKIGKTANEFRNMVE